MASAPVDGQDVDILLIGGGVAAAAAAEELREQGFAGTIALASRESDPPYYRFYLTKEYLRGHIPRDDLLVHSPEWWDENEVDLWLRAPVMELDTTARTAKIGRRTVRWGKALIATGANIRPLSCRGAGLAGVHYLRTAWNADALRDDLDGARSAVVVGGSFLAAETAASLTSLGIQVTMVYPEAVPLATSLGRTIGRIAESELVRLGVTLVPGSTVESVCGDDHVESVALADGKELSADTVVVGIGAVPETTLAKRAGLDLGDTGGVLCDHTLRTEHESVWAAGDVCEFESVRHQRSTRIEHDRVAAAQGQHAARSMLGSTEPFDALPYFWTCIGDDLRVDVLTLDSPEQEATRVDLEAQPEFAARFIRSSGPGPAPEAYQYNNGSSTVGYASVNGALALQTVSRKLTLTDLTTAQKDSC